MWGFPYYGLSVSYFGALRPFVRRTEGVLLARVDGKVSKPGQVDDLHVLRSTVDYQSHHSLQVQIVRNFNIGNTGKLFERVMIFVIEGRAYFEVHRQLKTNPALRQAHTPSRPRQPSQIAPSSDALAGLDADVDGLVADGGAALLESETQTQATWRFRAS